MTARDRTSRLKSERASERFLNPTVLIPLKQVRENKISQLTAITGFIPHALLPVPIRRDLSI